MSSNKEINTYSCCWLSSNIKTSIYNRKQFCINKSYLNSSGSKESSNQEDRTLIFKSLLSQTYQHLALEKPLLVVGGLYMECYRCLVKRLLEVMVWLSSLKLMSWKKITKTKPFKSLIRFQIIIQRCEQLEHLRISGPDVI